MNSNQENQKCLRPSCQGEIIKKEVYHDVSPYDACIETNYSISICDDNSCQVGKRKLEELEYWKKLSDELGVPDLKYWKMNYDRSSNFFLVIVENIQEDGVETGTPKHVWVETISPEAVSEAFGSRLTGNLLGVGDNRFRDLITKSLKLIAIEIKKTRQKEANKSVGKE